MADLEGEPRKSKHIQCERGSKRKLTIKTNRAHAKTRQKERESDRKTQRESSKPKRPEAAEAKTNQSFFYWGLSGRMTWGHACRTIGVYSSTIPWRSAGTRPRPRPRRRQTSRDGQLNKIASLRGLRVRRGMDAGSHGRHEMILLEAGIPGRPDPSSLSPRHCGKFCSFFISSCTACSDQFLRRSRPDVLFGLTRILEMAAPDMPW